MRDRACGAVIVDQQILMVRHSHDSRKFWTLPGGGINEGETAESTVVREILEETGLALSVVRLLFSQPYSVGLSYCHLMSTPTPDQQASLGHDPEDSHLPQSERTLQDVAWHIIDSMRSDIQVSRVIECLGLEL